MDRKGFLEFNVHISINLLECVYKHVNVFISMFSAAYSFGMYLLRDLNFSMPHWIFFSKTYINALLKISYLQYGFSKPYKALLSLRKGFGYRYKGLFISESSIVSCTENLGRPLRVLIHSPQNQTSNVF